MLQAFVATQGTLFRLIKFLLTNDRSAHIIAFAGNSKRRSVAQFGRALRSGRRGRRFKSCRFDPYFTGVSEYPGSLFSFPNLPKIYHTPFITHNNEQIPYVLVNSVSSFFIYFGLNDDVHAGQYFLLCLLIFDFGIDLQGCIDISVSYPFLDAFHIESLMDQD